MKVLIQQTEVQYLTITREIEMTPKQYKEYLAKGDYYDTIENELFSATEIGEFGVQLAQEIEVIENTILEVDGKENIISLTGNAIFIN